MSFTSGSGYLPLAVYTTQSSVKFVHPVMISSHSGVKRDQRFHVNSLNIY